MRHKGREAMRHKRREELFRDLCTELWSPAAVGSGSLSTRKGQGRTLTARGDGATRWAEETVSGRYLQFYCSALEYDFAMAVLCYVPCHCIDCGERGASSASPLSLHARLAGCDGLRNAAKCPSSVKPNVTDIRNMFSPMSGH